MDQWQNIFREYTDYQHASLNSRYVSHTALENLLEEKDYSKKIIGYSHERRAIYKLSVGNGSQRLLMWSQMHGNETTALRAGLDLWNFLHSGHSMAENFLKTFTVHFIPQLNPDGAERYTRRNALHIDINRDFLQEASVEIRLLKTCVQKGDYQALLNMHDQRSIFHPSQSNHPSTISLLAPAMDANNHYNRARVESESLAGYIFQQLQNFLPNGISRFDDRFYPLATGDNFMKQNIPILLLECGHFQQDYHRNETRRFTFLTLLLWLLGLYEGQQKNKLGQDFYHTIPVNDDKCLDVIVYNVNIVNNQLHKCTTDIGIQFEEIVQNHEIFFQGKIVEIGDLRFFHAHRAIDAQGLEFHVLDSQPLQLGTIPKFTLNDKLYDFIKIEV